MAISSGECHLKLVWLCKWLELSDPTFIVRETIDRVMEVVVCVEHEISDGVKENKEFVGTDDNFLHSAKEDACRLATEYLRDLHWSNPTIPKFLSYNIFPDTDVAWRHAYEELDKCHKFYVESYKRLKNEFDYSSFYKGCLEEIHLRNGGNQLLDLKQENCHLKWETRKIKLENLAVKKSLMESDQELMDCEYKLMTVKREARRLKKKLNDVQGSSGRKGSSKKRTSSNESVKSLGTQPQVVLGSRKGKEKVVEPVTPDAAKITSDESESDFLMVRAKRLSRKQDCIGCGQLWKH